jgi:predicted metalloprotease with PDZ domain
VTTGLDSLPGEQFVFRAPNYDHLIDCPLEIGNQSDYGFEVDGIPHVLSFAGAPPCSVEALIADVSRVVRMNSDFWGALPYNRYVFLFHGTEDGGGATEHINSTIVLFRARAHAVPESCSSILGTVSHEFFHTWNVKRLRPRGMDPYDWTGENYYRELWIAEGATSYLHNLLMLREGFRSSNAYIQGIASTVASDRGRPGNLEQSVAACSFDAWIDWLGNADPTFNFKSDFYSRGANVCMNLDLEIRHRSGNSASFDDVLRTLYERFSIGSGGYTVDDVQRVASELAGGSMAWFFQAFVHGTAPLPWERSLQYAGLVLTPSDTVQRPWLGLSTSEREGRTRVRTVVHGSPAYKAGINAGDELLALNGYRVRADDLQERVDHLAFGQEVRIVLFRDGKLRTFAFALNVPRPPTYEVGKVENPSDLQKSIFSGWLGVEWGAQMPDEL